MVIAGDGSLKAALSAQAARLGVADAVRLLGHHSDVVSLHHGLDLFVQSSDYEGTSNAVLEAMALETPLVATDAGGTRDLVRDDIDGVVVRCGDPVALAEAIDRTLTDRAAAARRASAARLRVERDLAFERRTRALEDIYQEIAAR